MTTVAKARFQGELRAEIERLTADNERLRDVCRTIAAGLRGQYATRLDMAKLADSALETKP